MTDASPRYHLHRGDCRDVMASMEAESFHSIVCDPPYGLGFMGHGWDHAVPGVEFWTAIMRVAKPGAHLVAFGGTRTWHRLSCAIEDAGWEIRDSLAWMTGQGMPKSLNVGREIDRRGGVSVAWFGPWLRVERERRQITQRELSQHFPSDTGGLTGCVSNWELGYNLPTPDQFNRLCELLGLPFDRLEEAERVVLEQRRAGGQNRRVEIVSSNRPDGLYDVTAPATDAAKQ